MRCSGKVADLESSSVTMSLTEARAKSDAPAKKASRASSSKERIEDDDFALNDEELHQAGFQGSWVSIGFTQSQT